MRFPEPVISLAVEPKSSGDLDKLNQSLARLAQEDPSLKVSTSEDTGQMLISGMGELHLQIIADRLVREFKVDANIGKPQVAYRECIGKKASATEEFSRTINNKNMMARVSVSVEPNPEIIGVNVVVPPKAGVSPLVLNALKESLEGAASSGAVCGYPLVNVSVKVDDYTYDASAIDEVCYKVASSNALRAALEKAKPTLVEPVMKVEIVVPGEYSGTIVSDVSSRRGHVNGMESRGHLQVVMAEIPLSELFGYETDIRSLSQGRASSSMHFSKYQSLPQSLQDKILGIT